MKPIALLFRKIFATFRQPIKLIDIDSKRNVSNFGQNSKPIYSFDFSPNFATFRQPIKWINIEVKSEQL